MPCCRPKRKIRILSYGKTPNAKISWPVVLLAHLYFIGESTALSLCEWEAMGMGEPDAIGQEGAS